MLQKQNESFHFGSNGMMLLIEGEFSLLFIITVEKMFQVNTDQLRFIFQTNSKIHYTHSCTCNISATLLLRSPMELSAKHKIENRLNCFFVLFRLFLDLIEATVSHTSQQSWTSLWIPFMSFRNMVLTDTSKRDKDCSSHLCLLM